MLYGDVNPSAKLPYTIAKQRSDYGVDVIYDQPAGILQIPYTEGYVYLVTSSLR